MMLWLDVTEERLEKDGEVDTPIDPLRWLGYTGKRASGISPDARLYVVSYMGP